VTEQANPGIRRANENIGALKVAIRKEKSTLRDYKERLRTGRGGFPEAGLHHGIERCEHNIQVLRDAVVREKANIREMAGQQRIHEEMARLQHHILVPVEYVDEDGDA
jgi:hypothetical protein